MVQQCIIQSSGKYNILGRSIDLLTVHRRKITNKKHKGWDGDGVLVVSGGYASLKDADGRNMGRTACKVPLLPGSTLSMSGKEIEVDSLLSKEEIQARKPISTIPRPDPAPSNAPRLSQVLPTGQKSVPRHKSLDKTIRKESRQSVQPARINNAAFKNPLTGKTVVRAKSDGTVPAPRHDPQAERALVMKRPKSVPQGKHIVDVVVDPILTEHLRQHQRDGIAFLYECVMGMRPFDGEGAILADEMGLGKTLQTIGLIWTLLKQNPIYEDGPVVRKVLIVCPVTLIKNWQAEFRKWIGERIGVKVAENSKTRISDFTKAKSSYSVMIIGYDLLRNVQEDLQKGAGIDLVICDEGHRLKTAGNKSALAIKSLNTERRIILSGTPIQNDLSEFYTMVDFVNPGLLNKYTIFKRDFETPILDSRQPEASSGDIEKGQAKSKELAAITSLFILRRTSELLSKYLPPKTETVLFCRPTSSQAAVYEAIIKTGLLNTAINHSQTSLQMIDILKKACNSPSLLLKSFKEDPEETASLLSSLLAGVPRAHLRHPSGSKLQTLDSLLLALRTKTSEKVVIVSNYTATLDIIGNLLNSLEYPFLRLDGSTAISSRQDLVNQFNRSPASSHFAFLLSAKAGGQGINLIGASRLILFDIDWNPATDLQAMGRIHRDGQKRPCYIYRLVTKGALEEKIFQRQITKQGLADSIVDNKSSASSFSPEELRDLFTLDQREGCQTHDLLGCDCGGAGIKASVDEEASPQASSSTADESEETDGEDLPELPSFMRSSQVDMEAQERKRRERSDKARAKSNNGKGSMSSLLRYAHVDTAKLRSAGKASLDTTKEVDTVDLSSSTAADEKVKSAMEMAIEDDILRSVIEEDTARVDYVFSKTSS